MKIEQEKANAHIAFSRAMSTLEMELLTGGDADKAFADCKKCAEDYRKLFQWKPKEEAK